MIQWKYDRYRGYGWCSCRSDLLFLTIAGFCVVYCLHLGFEMMFNWFLIYNQIRYWFSSFLIVFSPFFNTIIYSNQCNIMKNVEAVVAYVKKRSYWCWKIGCSAGYTVEVLRGFFERFFESKWLHSLRSAVICLAVIRRLKDITSSASFRLYLGKNNTWGRY